MRTKAQIAANRLNAQKSTGPRTPEGKAVVSRNAIKHTALARNLLFADPNSATTETSAEFKALCDNYYAELQPVGHLEKLLVDQIVAGVWRTRRARQAEIGEISLSLESVADAKDNPKKSGGASFVSDHVARVLELAALSPGLDIIDLLAAKDQGCEFVLHSLRQARQMFERDPKITMEMVNVCFKPFGNHARSLTDPLTQMMEEVNAHADKPDARTVFEKHSRDVPAFFDGKIRHYEQLTAGRQTQINATVEARQKAAVLPDPTTLYKIMRHESTQERQIFRALNQLHKLQACRSAKGASQQ